MDLADNNVWVGMGKAQACMHRLMSLVFSAFSERAMRAIARTWPDDFAPVTMHAFATVTKYH